MNSYGFTPGVMIDPVTMNPIVRGGSITVNPMGMPVPVEQKPWLKFALMNIHEDMPDDIIKRLLGSLGKVVSFNRLQNQKTKINCGEDVVRICKFFKDVKIVDRMLDLKISEETKSFLRQWMTIQKEEWKKKLNATGMNEAKEYESLEVYLERDDKTIQDRFNNALKQANNDFRRVLQSKQRDDERKEHPKQKERDRRKRQLKDEQDKKYSQKIQYWTSRERQKERQYKKEAEREKDKDKMKMRKLEREMEMDDQEEKKRINKFLSSERRKLREKELEQDLQKIELEWLPPEPQLLGEVNAPEGPAPQQVMVQMQPRRHHTVHVEELIPEGDIEYEDLLQLQNLEKPRQSQPLPKVDHFYNQSQVFEKPKPGTLNLPLPPDAEEKRVDHAKQAEKKRIEQELLKIYKQIPRNKEGLWTYKIDWEVFSQANLFDRKIRPWLYKAFTKYLGEAEQNFISLIEKSIIKKASPDQLVKLLSKVLQNDTQRFVMDLWIELIFNILRVKNNIEEL